VSEPGGSLAPSSADRNCHPGRLAALFMSPKLKPVQERASALDALGLKRNLVRILFVHRFLAEVEHCLYELKKVRFIVSSDVVVTPEQFAERLRSDPYDLVLAEHPSPNWQETQALDVLHEMKKDIPVIFLVYGLKRETMAEFILKGAADCIEMDRISHLPVAVHQALDEKALRDQRDRAEKDLRRSEAHYRALAGNLNYGICRCSLHGTFLEVNGAMIKMLGYGSREELLAGDLARDILQDPARRAQLLGQSDADALVDPVEVEWERKDHTTLKVRLSGREVLSELGELEAYEVIAEDVTRQRELEDHLRRQAASDSLTGLANYRHLVDVLDAEIKRSNRTSREFALLFFDMDGLKRINDRYGHMVGGQALCRLADVLSSCCRSIDTPARFGGDEFAVVLPETSVEEANLVARRICESVANDGNGPKLSVSAGVAVYPRDGDTIEKLLREADSALYSMKQQKILPAEFRQAIAGR
jgi:diguanylate cyclase (GGDEF)-like protein/PAS domain S-box-containing protein